MSRRERSRRVLPKSRSDFRQPEELYAFNLKQFGVDMPPAELARIAHAAFDQIQTEMKTLAPTVAKEKGWTATDYRDVIRGLKKDQLLGEAILPHYQGRLKDIEGIISREKLVSLPTRPARIRLASAAETAATPAPNMRPPRLLGNTGEQGEFILPLNVPTTDGNTLKSDDFTFYGYTKLMELRTDLEKMLGSSFNQLEFHDFILSQGLLPPSLMRQAVLERFQRR